MPYVQGILALHRHFSGFPQLSNLLPSSFGAWILSVEEKQAYLSKYFDEISKLNIIHPNATIALASFLSLHDPPGLNKPDGILLPKVVREQFVHENIIGRSDLDLLSRLQNENIALKEKNLRLHDELQKVSKLETKIEAMKAELENLSKKEKGLIKSATTTLGKEKKINLFAMRKAFRLKGS